MNRKTLFCFCLVFLTISVFVSCKKDKFSEKTTTSPNTSNPILLSETISDANCEIGFQPIIGEKEIKQIIVAKDLIRELIRESLVQLLLNHHFNPLMPEIDTRLNCVTCTEADCGCPFQDQSIDPNPTTFPQLLALKYYDPNDVNCECLVAPDPNDPTAGLEITGEMHMRFSDPLTTIGHTITLYPQDNFTVKGYDFDADSIRIRLGLLNGDISMYQILNLENVAVSKNGDTTTVSNLPNNGGQSLLVITDVGSNHGDISNAFGLLDDIFELTLTRLVIECGNGELVMANSPEPLIYNMNCRNIEDGSVVLTEYTGSQFNNGGNTIATYDYGAPATGNDPGVCDDSISIVIPTNIDP